jgi:hypothetical protein
MIRGYFIDLLCFNESASVRIGEQSDNKIGKEGFG